MKEVKDDIKEVRKDIKKIFQLLPPKAVYSGSPLQQWLAQLDRIPTAAVPFQGALPSEAPRRVYIENSPSAQALKLMHLLVAQADGRIADDVQHDMRLSDIRKIEGMRNHDRASLQILFIELSSAILMYDDIEEKPVAIGCLLGQAQIDYREESTTGDLAVSWWFGWGFRLLAEQSNHWAILDRQAVFHLGHVRDTNSVSGG